MKLSTRALLLAAAAAQLAEAGRKKKAPPVDPDAWPAVGHFAANLQQIFGGGLESTYHACLALAAFADAHHVTADVLLAGVICASVFRNWLWRAASCAVSLAVLASGLVPHTTPAPLWAAALSLVACLAVPTFALFGIRPDQAEKGSVFVTGCDSGMGEATAVELCGRGYRTVYAGCYLPTAQVEPKLREKAAAAHGAAAAKKIVCVQCDVTKDASVAAAAAAVKAGCGSSPDGLVAVINCAGMGYNGPAEFFPVDMYQKQMDVNFTGYVRVAQAFLGHLRASAAKPGARRGRLVFIGTGGGVLSPAPPLLSAYMASKWAIEAFARCLRVEMRLSKVAIDVCVVNPGFVKPTALIGNGQALTASMWAKSLPAAKKEWGGYLDQFIAYSLEQPATHVSVVGETMAVALKAWRPASSYKVGPDSKAAPIVGMLPIDVSEWIVLKSMYGNTGSA